MFHRLESQTLPVTHFVTKQKMQHLGWGSYSLKVEVHTINYYVVYRVHADKNLDKKVCFVIKKIWMKFNSVFPSFGFHKVYSFQFPLVFYLSPK